MDDTELRERQAFESAAAQATQNVPIASPDDTAGALRRSLEGRRFESATHVAVTVERRLAGVLRIEELLAARDDAPLRDLMDRDPPAVAPGTDQEIAAWQAAQHGESALALIDGERRFLGFIPPHRLLAVLLWEHEEDMARLGGFMRDTAAARTAMLERLARRFWHRLPWLLAGLAGALFAADIVGAFEATLEGELVLAFFVPGIVYLADAVGTQTEAIVIRGLSVGVGIREVVWRELLTGASVGLALSLMIFPIVLLRWSQADIALTVALALFAACSVATAVAMALPWLLYRLGRDPAFGSGPLATVLQDLLSITIYLAIASAIVR